MGGDQAASTLLDITVAGLKRARARRRRGRTGRLRDKVKAVYDEQTDVRYAAARGWVDAIIDPAETRDALITALEVATRHAEDEPFRTGVLQV